MDRRPFEAKYYSSNGGEKAIDRLPDGCTFKCLPEGLSVYEDGEHVGNIKPAYPSDAKVLRLWALADSIP